jgi:hypothetical protein
MSVLHGNLDVTQADKMFPYSMGRDVVRKLLRLNLGVEREDPAGARA